MAFSGWLFPNSGIEPDTLTSSPQLVWYSMLNDRIILSGLKVKLHGLCGYNEYKITIMQLNSLNILNSYANVCAMGMDYPQREAPQVLQIRQPSW